MISLCKKFGGCFESGRRMLDKYIAPLFDLAARVYLANAFFSAGLTRLRDWTTGNFSTQIFLFTEEHPVPGIPADIAAYMTMAGELVLPVLVALGLFARFGALGLLVMAVTIELTYIHSFQHVLWGFLAASIFIRGPGKLSLDHLISARCCKG